MADSNSVVFGALPASSASFSYGTVDVKAKHRPQNRTFIVKGGRSRYSSGANTVSSETNSNLSSSTLTAPFSNPFPSSISPFTPGTSGDRETRTCPALFYPGSPSSNSMTTFTHAFSNGESVSSLVSSGNTPLSLSANAKPTTVPEKKVESVSSVRAENSRKDTQHNRQTTQKDNKTVPRMEETPESVSCPPLPLIPISRILKGIPHSPHFLQLRSYSQVARKSLMAGWDRAFEETVEEIHSLTAKDFWVRSSKLWKTIEELQSLGYNVLPRKRLVELTEVMEEQKLYKLGIRRLRSKAESHRMERSRLESVILGLQQRAQREQADLVEMLEEVATMEKDFPKFDGAFAVLAMERL